jgi:hypothetical protein
VVQGDHPPFACPDGRGGTYSFASKQGIMQTP